MNQTFISSDCSDIGEIKNSFALATDDAEAAAVAINAGVDQDLCVSTYLHGLPEAVTRGLVSTKTLDASVANILRQKFAAGLFEGSWKVNPSKVAGKLDSYRPLALEAARQGITLLTNTNETLPLAFAHKRIVVVGALADNEGAHVGSYTNGGAAVVTTWAAVEKECAAAPGCTATKVDGAAPGSFDTSGLQAAADAVSLADVVIAVVGDDLNTAGENHDVDDLDLPGAQLPMLYVSTHHHRRAHDPAIASNEPFLHTVLTYMTESRVYVCGGWGIADVHIPKHRVCVLSGQHSLAACVFSFLYFADMRHSHLLYSKLLFKAIAQSAAYHGTPIIAVVISAQPKTFGASLFNPVALGKPNFLVTSGMLNAVLAAWRPGEEGGTAIVEIVTGQYNPTGRLSHTWPAKAGQVHSVVANNYRMPASSAGGSFAFTTGPMLPLFPFGWGLSYASFKVGTPTATGPAAGQPVNSTQRFQVKVNVSCTGPAGSQTMLQVYTKPNFQLVEQSQPVHRLLCWGAVVFAQVRVRWAIETLCTHSVFF